MLRVFWIGIVGAALISPAVLPTQGAVAAQTGGREVAAAQDVSSISGRVVDRSGAAIVGARVSVEPVRGGSNAAAAAVTDSAGQFRLENFGASSAVRVEAEGFATTTVTYSPDQPLKIVMRVRPTAESVTVTAYRTPLASEDSPASTRVLSSRDLEEAASPALDDKLRLVPGVELFRRSSSLVANPTSQGLSLRGLGSTAASRTLVVSDDVPLNDPYGGWIHWTELPELSIRSVELVRGGASDLYGSSAIGGVVNLLGERPTRDRLTLLSSYGGENTLDQAVFGSATRPPWSGLVSGGILRTDGYTLVAPGLRGPVDVPSNVRSQNGITEIDRRLYADGRMFLRGSAFNEARSNGTLLQTNATRLWRYSAGADLPVGTAGVGQAGSLSLRFYGSEEHYRQSFSAIAAGRVTESQTRFEHTPAQELGAVAHWSEALRPALLLVLGTDTHDVRATDTELSIQRGRPAGLLDTTARQRQTGIYAETLWTPRNWTISAGGRVDHFSNFDARQSGAAGVTPGAVAALPSFAETVFNPRVGLSRHLLPSLAPNLVWSASAFRAYRAPTQNELYRTGQVGQETTQPNSELRSERATGWETGVEAAGATTTARLSYFWTQVNRPITALTLSSTPTQILDKRENLGQIESRGISVDFESAPCSWVTLTGGYQYADATVTRSAAQMSLVGKWIPQVARNTATAQVRFARSRVGTLSLQGRLGGRQYDDASNRFLLHGYFPLDAYASRNFGRHVEFFAAGENILDRAIEVGRTPMLTLGTPAIARLGVRIHLGD